MSTSYVILVYRVCYMQTSTAVLTTTMVTQIAYTSEQYFYACFNIFLKCYATRMV